MANEQLARTTRYSSFISIWSCFAETSVVVFCCREWKFWLNRADDTSNDATVYTYVNHEFDGANPLRAEIPHFHLCRWKFKLSPCASNDIDISIKTPCCNTWSILKIAQDAKLSNAKRTLDACAVLPFIWVSWYSARNIAIDKKINAKERIRISLWGEHRVYFFTCHLIHHARSFVTWKKKRITIAGRFAFVQQQRTTLTKMVHNRGLVPARQGTRQEFYRGPKSLPLSRVETPK